MRLHEIFTDEEWQRLEQLIYATAYRALTAYQQHRATAARVQQIAIKPTATLKPQATKKAKALARKAKRSPHAAPPKQRLRPIQLIALLKLQPHCHPPHAWQQQRHNPDHLNLPPSQLHPAQ